MFVADTDFREQFEVDSMDLLSFLIALPPGDGDRHPGARLRQA